MGTEKKMTYGKRNLACVVRKKSKGKKCECETYSDAFSHLWKKFCLLVRPSTGPSVRPFIPPSVIPSKIVWILLSTCAIQFIDTSSHLYEIQRICPSFRPTVLSSVWPSVGSLVRLIIRLSVWTSFLPSARLSVCSSALPPIKISVCRSPKAFFIWTKFSFSFVVS